MAQGGAPGHVSLEYQFAQFVSIAYLPEWRRRRERPAHAREAAR